MIEPRNSPEPAVHQARERAMIEHVLRLLDDPRLIVDTRRGRRPVTSLRRDVSRSDHGIDLKRLMSEMNRPDRALQDRLPVGEWVEVILSTIAWLMFKRAVGRLRVACVSPTRQLIAGDDPRPMTSAEVEKAVRAMPPVAGGVPTTIVLISTSGFALDAHEQAERTSDRTLILVEPNDAGGWTAHGPAETRAVVELFDPEADAQKRERIRDEIEAAKNALPTGGIAADTLAEKTRLSLNLVEAELKSYASENAGLAAKRIDGRVVLFRLGQAPPAAASPAQGALMPLIDTIRSLFSRKGETEKKIAFLSERRTALTQQRDRAYEEIGAIEKQDAELVEQFKTARAPLTRRRITTQLVQLRKDIERRQQMLSVLNQQVNVVSTHLHNLELSQQGQVAKLPDSEEIAQDAAAAEEMLAELQADNELADSVSGVATSGMSDEEQALYEQLEKESGGLETTAIKLDHAEAPPGVPAEEPPVRSPQPKRAEPEAG
ncbi:MAG: hypothetical protein ACREJC_14005 [Tepidisphaeraceae bacterium]